jgi:hypothetical protein
VENNKKLSIEWIAIGERLPDHEQRVLAFVPDHRVYLPGKTGETELREVIVLRFLLDFYPDGSERRITHGAHFWAGEGNSNHFFHAVSHWMPIPEKP